MERKKRTEIMVKSIDELLEIYASLGNDPNVDKKLTEMKVTDQERAILDHYVMKAYDLFEKRSQAEDKLESIETTLLNVTPGISAFIGASIGAGVGYLLKGQTPGVATAMCGGFVGTVVGLLTECIFNPIAKTICYFKGNDHLQYLKAELVHERYITLTQLNGIKNQEL